MGIVETDEASLDAQTKKPDDELARCADCGSTELQITAWVTLNGKEVIDDEGPDNQVWCPECETFRAKILWPEDQRKRDREARHAVLQLLAETAFTTYRDTYEKTAAAVYGADTSKGYVLDAAADRACSSVAIDAARIHVANMIDKEHTLERRAELIEALTNFDLESVTWEGAKVVRHVLQGPIS